MSRLIPPGRPHPKDDQHQQHVALVPSVMTILRELAREDGVTPEVLLAALVQREDENRHVVWSPAQQAFVRYKCGRPTCAEPLEFPPDRGSDP